MKGLQAQELTMNQQSITTENAHYRQNGGALLVAMIMIFMLSIMGVSSMQGSTLERRMASNSIQTATTFQGAESTSEIALNDPSLMTQAINIADIQAVNSGELNNSNSLEIDVNLFNSIDMDSDAIIQYIGDGPAYGYSTGSGSSNFVGYQFLVEGRSKVNAIKAEKSVLQGAYRIAPGR